MIFAPADFDYLHSDCAVNAPQSQELLISGDSNTMPDIIKCVTYPQRVLPLDDKGHCLRLWECPVLKLDIKTYGCEVEDWGVRIDLADVTDLPRAMARTFLMLWTKAERQNLTSDEAAQWECIVDKVDYQRFCTDRAPFRYVEGLLLERHEDVAIIQWHDGSRSTIRDKVLRSLVLVDEGDIFSAYVKLNDQNRVSEMEFATPLGYVNEVTQETQDGWLDNKI